MQQPTRDHRNRRVVARRPEHTVEPSAASQASLHPLLALQRQVGNAQIARMLAQRQPTEEEELQAKRDSDLAQRAAEDEEEVQMRRDASLAQRDHEEDEVQASRDSDLAQRQPTEEEELQASRDSALTQRQTEEEELQMQRDGSLAQREPEVGFEGGPVSDETANRINSKRGSGTALDENTRAQMENSFGTSFEDVRVHTDSESDTLSRQLGAKAFTTGSDIFFQSGAYQPGSSDGQELLSHELTHVVQQRSMSASGPMRVTPGDDASERQADAMAQQVASRAQRQVEREAD